MSVSSVPTMTTMTRSEKVSRSESISKKKDKDKGIVVNFDKLIGYGSYGKIYTCIERPNSVFKVFFDTTLSISCIELDCMFRLHHPYIMSAIDIYTIKKVPSKLKKGAENVVLLPNGVGRFLVIEMERAECDLYEFDRSVAYEVKLKMIWQILQAIHFVHSCHLLHLDIKTNNVLVMKDGSVKLTDFGLAVPVTTHGRSREYAREAITDTYRPPEHHDKRLNKRMVKRKNQYLYRQASDVWSLGVVFAELFMLQQKYFIEDKHVKMLDAIFKPEAIENTIKIKIGRGLPSIWYPILREMLDYDPEKRPTVSQLLQNPVFDSLRNSEIEPKRDNNHILTSLNRAKSLISIPNNISMEGFVIQPIFPPPDSKLTNEDYTLKLECFMYNTIHTLAQVMAHQDENYPVQVLFTAADLFLRYRHFYDKSEEILAIALYISTQMLNENEIDFGSLEYHFKVTDLEKRWREFLFLPQEYNKCIFLSDTPFTYANCKCRLEKILELLFTKPQEYVKMYYLLNDSQNILTHDCFSEKCDTNPSWRLKDWLAYIRKIAPALKL